MPKYAVALAEICAKWSEIEHVVVLAYSGVLQIPYAAAKHALHNSPNSNSRFKMLRSAVAEFPPSRDFKRQMDAALEKAQHLAGRRARYIHGRWCVRGDGRVFLIDPAAEENSQKAQRPVNHEDMLELCSEMENCCATLMALVDLVRPLPALPNSIAQRKRRSP